MENGLTHAESAAICDHMNDDHADAVAAYARTFGGLAGVTAARMVGLDRDGMDLAVELGGTRVATRVAFDHPLADKTDARTTLIAMAHAAGGGATTQETPASAGHGHH